MSGEELGAIERVLTKYIVESNATDTPDDVEAEDRERDAAGQLVAKLVTEVRTLQAWREKAMIALAAAQRHLALGKPADSKYIIRLGDK